MAVRSGYSGLQIGLHWLIAVLIVSAWWTGDGARSALDAFEETAAAPGFVPHVALGLAVLALVVLRVIVRLTRGAPEAPGVPGSLPVRAAGWGHLLIYVLMIAVPLGGISAWFFGLETGDIHSLAANVLMVIALGHSAFALYHQYVVKDGLLRRMMKAE
jgi:cytochrome b561